MKVWSVLALVLCMTSIAYGSRNSLVEEFLESSLDIKISDLTYSSAELQRDTLRATRTWTGSLTSSIDDNQLDPVVETFNANQIKTTNYALEFSKAFEFGLNASLSSEYTKQDRSSISGILATNDPIIYEFGQTLSFTQDLGRNFFGRQFYYQLRGINESINFSRIQLEESKQIALSNFYRNLLIARQRKTLMKIAQESFDWNKKNLAITQKRVKDGLNEKADLYQARLNERLAKENLENAKFQYKSIKLQLSEELRREIKDNEIEEVELKKVDLTKNIDFTLQENFDYRQALARIRQLEWEKRQIDRDFYPSIQFSTSYATNQFDANKETTFDQGTLGGDDDNLTVALSISVPLTFAAEKASLASKRIELIQAELQKEQVEEQLKYTSNRLKEQMITRKNNLLTSEKRLTFAKQNLKENNRLYNIGRIDIDRLLRAEEDFLNTQRSFVNNWFEYEVAISEKAALYGKLLDVLRIKI